MQHSPSSPPPFDTPRVCITPMFLACVFVCAHNYVNVVATNVEVIFLTLNHALNVSSRHFEILLFITIPSSPKLWRKERNSGKKFS